MIADILSNKNRSELFITGRKLNDSLVFILQSYFAVPKNVKLNSTFYFIMKIPNKREFQEIAFNHSSDIDFQDSFFAKSVLPNHVLFWLLILLFHQIILYPAGMRSSLRETSQRSLRNISKEMTFM